MRPQHFLLISVVLKMLVCKAVARVSEPCNFDVEECENNCLTSVDANKVNVNTCLYDCRQELHDCKYNNVWHWSE